MFLAKLLANYNPRAISRHLYFFVDSLSLKDYFYLIFTRMEDIATMFQNAEELASYGRREEAMNRYSQFIDLAECKLKVLPNEPVKFKL